MPSKQHQRQSRTTDGGSGKNSTAGLEKDLSIGVLLSAGGRGCLEEKGGTLSAEHLIAERHPEFWVLRRLIVRNTR
jgi:hypothetical protein